MIKRKPKAVANATNVKEIKGISKDGDGVNEPVHEAMLICKGEQKIGISKGITINTGNYESARINVWVERIIPEGEKERTKNLQELSEYLDDWLIVESKELKS